MWESANPRLRTHEQGTSLAKYNLPAGDDIPDSWLPLDLFVNADSEFDEGGMDFYPAVTRPTRRVADHHPVTLGLRGMKENPKPCLRALRGEDLSSEE